MKLSVLIRRHRLLAAGAAVASLLLPAGPAFAAPGPSPAAASGADVHRTASVTVEGVLNFRDAGGHTVAGGGHMRQGALYRSGSLQSTTDAGLETLSGLGLTKVVDFRSTGELAAGADRLPSGVDAVSYPVEANDRLGSFEELLSMSAAEQRELLGDGGAEDMMLTSGRRFVTVPERRAQFGRALRDIAASGEGATLIHCTGGRDRTGWLIAIAQTAVGVPRSEVFADYLRSNTELAAWKASVLRRLADSGMEDPQLVAPLLDVDASYLQASFDQAAKSYGSFDAFVREGLGIDGATLERLRARLR